MRKLQENAPIILTLMPNGRIFSLTVGCITYNVNLNVPPLKYAACTADLQKRNAKVTQKAR